MKRLGVLGGSGLYEMEGLTVLEELSLDTPYGTPSDAIRRGRLEGTDVELLFLPRHGRGHRLSPSHINYRANICALKQAKADAILSVSAVGSMKEEIAPGDLVVVDQLIDLTKQRQASFFGEGVVAHVAMADPVCPVLAAAVTEAARTTGAKVHGKGTYVCIEGPAFSTRAESLVYRSWGVSVIGMTNMPEAKLAREAQLPYATLALSTDYDCWHASEEAVTVDAVIAVLKQNVKHAKTVIARLARQAPDLSSSPALRALENAVITPPDQRDQAALTRLAWLLGDG